MFYQRLTASFAKVGAKAIRHRYKTMAEHTFGAFGHYRVVKPLHQRRMTAVHTTYHLFLSHPYIL